MSYKWWIVIGIWWGMSLAYAFIGGVDVQRYYITKNCLGGDWLINSEGGEMGGGGCVKLPDPHGIYQIKRVRADNYYCHDSIRPTPDGYMVQLPSGIQGYYDKNCQFVHVISPMQPTQGAAK